MTQYRRALFLRNLELRTAVKKVVRLQAVADAIGAEAQDDEIFIAQEKIATAIYQMNAVL